MHLYARFNRAVKIKDIPGKGKALVATRNIRLGECFGFFAGKKTKETHMHTITLDGKTIDGTGKKLSFLAHSCDSNAIFKDQKRWLYAKKDITKGDEVTIDYLETEPEITEPFQCECKATNCRGLIG